MYIYRIFILLTVQYPENCNIRLRSALYNGRLVVETFEGIIVGNLPTKYNYLLTYIKLGNGYSGTVVSSGISPIPYAVVNLYAI